ncbi:OmpA-like transmembrane domain protein [Variibacter gotjawalensis]|uniref:OmpA-like transmembrane domain protein n=1 Tax=Variibacter gotjawalensis TaxID=1333996 RepID=A0A0S3PUP2_9BRAD|nr:outer membrane protein [Variibacter gotjawalensis]NIK49861.1 outer membrane immunogenic protein [Variibacter gotjawalensis]RZS45860.1 outer membrane immunogenic protein [Variibacter gotjawalensis]BAT59536.1 OmpA-like transmembrane domain protein [Variibacter gotjawalensis]
MFKTLTAASIVALCAAAPALAADLGRPVYKAPMVMPVYFSWNGFYIGGNAGYAWSHEDVRTTGQSTANIANVAGGARPANVGMRPSGFTGGAQMGYNMQAGNWVYGIEADIAYTDLSETRTIVTTGLAPGFAPNLQNTFRQELEYLGTVRGRLGYSWDRTLLYVTGGFAYGGVNNSATFTGANGAVVQFQGGRDRIRTGYAIGGGAEHALAGNWSVKLEYLYYDLGRDNINVALVPGSLGAPTGYNSRFDNSGHLVRAGINYRFGGVPIVASY